MLNELTERNLDMWKSMQNRFLSAASTAMRGSGHAPAEKPAGKGERHR